MVGPRCIATVALFIGCPQLASADTNLSLWDMSLEQLAMVPVASTASGTVTPLDKSASITTVFTAEDIRRVGATNIDELLQSVPGLFVSQADQALSSQYIFRGITSMNNPQALLMINSIPFKGVVFGNLTNIWHGMNVEAIERIEVVRGPGSALYGADAFAGVINLITKSGQDINGTQAGVSAGSFNARSAWAQYGERKGEWETMASIQVSKTDGDASIVERDLQSQLDDVFATNISLAPGPVRRGTKSIDARVEAKTERVVARLGYQGIYDDEVAVGIAGALDPQGTFNSDRISADIAYARDDLMQDWVWTTRANALYLTQEPDEYSQLFPPGAFGGTFPDGMIGSPGFKEVQVGLEQLGVYDGFENRRIRLVAGGLWADVYETSDTVNFEITPDPVLGATFDPRGGLVDVSDTADVWLPEEKRTIVYAALQDEWRFAERWQLTSGIRYDHFSDFGGTLNPRMALVWATTEQWTSRLLYGRAFRAPSIEELYSSSNPVALGDPNLDPEIIDSVELALAYRDDRRRHLSATLFHYDIKDYIERVPNGVGGQNQSANGGARRGHGVELEGGFMVLPSVQLRSNYAWVHAEDKRSGELVGEAPEHQAYLALDWQLAPTWQLGTQLNWFGRIARTEGDTRDPLDSAAVLDLTLRRQKIFDKAEITVRLRNILDEDYATPSPGPAVTLPGDFPRPGFNGDVVFRYHF